MASEELAGLNAALDAARTKRAQELIQQTQPDAATTDLTAYPGLDRGAVTTAPSPGTLRTLLEMTGMSLFPEIAAPIRAGLTLGKMAIRAGAAGAGGAAGSLAAETVDPSKNPGMEAAKAAAVGLTAGPVGDTVAAAVGPKVISQAGQDAMRLVGDKGGVVPPGTVSNSRVLQLLQEVADASIFGGKVSDALKNSEKIITGDIENFAATFAKNGTKEDVGAVIQDSIDNGTAAFRAKAKSYYSKVDQLAGGASVDVTPVQALAGQLKEQFAAGLPGAAPGATAVLDSLMSRNAPALSFGDAQVLRSDLLAITRSSTDLIPARAQKIAGELAATLDRQMETAAAGLSDDALGAWRMANRFYKSGQETFNNKLIKSLANKDPEAVYSAAVKNGKPGTIRRVREIVGADDWTQVQGQFLSDLMGKSTDTSGNFAADGALKTLKSFGDDSFKELFPKAEDRQNVTTLLRALNVVQDSPKSGDLRVMMRWTQGGALASLVTGVGSVAPSTIAAVVLTPAVLASVLTNRTAATWLAKGISADGAEAAAATAKFMGYLGERGLLYPQTPAPVGNQPSPSPTPAAPKPTAPPMTPSRSTPAFAGLTQGDNAL